MTKDVVKTTVLVNDDNETINAMNPQFSKFDTKETFKDFLGNLQKFCGATVKLQEF